MSERSAAMSSASLNAKTSAKVIEKQQQNASKFEEIATKLLDSINVNEMNRFIGIESNLALLMTMSSGFTESKNGKMQHENIDVKNFEFLEFEIEIDDKCVRSVANSMDGLGYESSGGFEDDFIELITTNSTKMQIYPIVDKENVMDSFWLWSSANVSGVEDAEATDTDTATDTETDPIDQTDAEIPFGNQIELSIMTGDSPKQMDAFGIVCAMTAYPYEKPIQRIFEIFESVYCLESGVKRRCFMCLRMTASYSVISGEVAKIFRNTMSQNDRYVCRRCYESAKLFLINAEKQILANEPLAAIECAQIDYTNCSTKFLLETEVPPSVNIGKLDVDFKSYRYQVERDYPILRQQMHYFKRYMIESLMPTLRLRLKQFKRHTNPNILAIGRYLEAVVSLFRLIDSGLANALTMFRCVRSLQKQMQTPETDAVVLADDPEPVKESPNPSDLLAKTSLRFFWPLKQKMPVPELSVGQTCLVQTTASETRPVNGPGLVWTRARILQLFAKSPMVQISCMDFAANKRRGLRYKSMLEMKHLRQIAFFEPHPAQLQVGERVVAQFHRHGFSVAIKTEKGETTAANCDDDTDSNSGRFYAGHILETLSDLNKNRYLIMFENGDVRYVHHYFVRKTLITDQWCRNECIHHVYLNVYFQLYPKKKSMHVSSRKVFYVEHGGEWEKAKIIYYDCSIAFIEHLNCHRLEWVALTSHRITTNEKMSISESAYRRSIVDSGLAYRLCQSTRSYLDDVYRFDDVDAIVNGGAFAGNVAAAGTDAAAVISDSSEIGLKRKISGDTSLTTAGHDDKRLSLSVKLAKLVAQASSLPTKAAENGNAAMKTAQLHKLRVLTASPLPFEVAGTRLDANCACIEAIRKLAASKTKILNPLRKPEEYGWKRIEIKKSHNLSSTNDNGNGTVAMAANDAATDPDIIIEEFVKSFIFYKTPCDKVLGDVRLLYQHLLDTDSPLLIENFSFDRDVQSDRELVESPSQILIKNDDLSFGKENIPVSVVNSLNYQCPTDFTYLTGRQPSSNIQLNLSSDFVICCDCTDDCSDWTKCACRKLTVDEAQITIKSMDSDEQIPNAEIGYQFMRLKKSMKCAIYECNEGCRCSKRCLNRVAQFPLRQSLQLYMTEKRGWGLRALHDIPKGTFICRYGGIIMTDDEANNDGLIFGDEYFADLDYIEVVESIKEGYEDSVVDTDETGSQNTPTEDDNDNLDSDTSSSIMRRKSKRKCVLKKNHAKQRRGAAVAAAAAMSSESATKSTKKREKKNERPSQTRELYKDGNTEMFIMDAKSSGNVGRYFNHSCEPNLFVQNVFIETHDIRFPWVCFFASRLITAGEELTWDYNYTPGSVPGRQIICMCGTKSCRGRLL